MHRIRYKSRGVTPVIATVLLIGLVVVAGIGVALVVFGTINTPSPLNISVLSISDFESTDNDFFVDHFSVTLQNTERTNVRIKQEAFSIYNRTKSPESEITGWIMDLNQAEIILPALTIETFPISCDTDLNENELTPRNDTIYIKVTVYPEGSDNPRAAKTFFSDLLIVGDTYGPFYLTSQQTNLNLGQSGLNLSINIANFGSTDTNLVLDISTDSMQSLYFAINGLNSTSQMFSVNRYTNISLTDSITVYPIPSGVSNGNKYFVLIFLKDQENQVPLASLFLELTYQD